MGDTYARIDGGLAEFLLAQHVFFVATVAWTANKGPAGVAGYQATKNRRSLDGLPGLKPRGE